MIKKETPLISNELLQLLVCPVSGGKLELEENTENSDVPPEILVFLKMENESNTENKISGWLFCRQSRLSYPIKSGIPVLIHGAAKKCG